LKQRKKEDMKAGLATVTSADGTAIAFDRVGEGPPVILVGGALNYRSFPPLVELAAHLAPSFTAYSYDRRGRGDSEDTPPYDVAREIEDLGAVIAEAGGSASVYGLSSGAVLALEGAARGLPITKLALFEPPLPLEESPSSETDVVPELIAAGRGGEAVEAFVTGIGLPAEVVAGMRQSPMWPVWEAMAHTLLYDGAITEDRALLTERLPTVRVPTLVLSSGASGPYLLDSAKAVAGAVPNAEHRVLEGEFHDVPAEVIAATVSEFFAD
jgi:pimeloyl-ACP methyl ester carboxylesterase